MINEVVARLNDFLDPDGTAFSGGSLTESYNLFRADLRALLDHVAQYSKVSWEGLKADKARGLVWQRRASRWRALSRARREQVRKLTKLEVKP